MAHPSPLPAFSDQNRRCTVCGSLLQAADYGFYCKNPQCSQYDWITFAYQR